MHSLYRAIAVAVRRPTPAATKAETMSAELAEYRRQDESGLLLTTGQNLS
jgi:hypothetical protein